MSLHRASQAQADNGFAFPACAFFLSLSRREGCGVVRRLAALLCLTVGFVWMAGGTAQAQKRGLDIYFVDTEGGAATLLVTPASESILIDCGNPGDRDADRIAKAAKDAGLKAIDHLILTHWHNDHYGGALPLSKRIPILHFYDRGIPDTLADDPNFPTLIAAYREASHGQSTTLHPGDTLTLRQAKTGPTLSLRTLCASGEVIPPSHEAQDNPFAAAFEPKPVDTSDNAKSLGFLLTCGAFKFLNLGDLTWNIEYKLVAPTDKIGPVDVYQATHHGLDISNNPVLIKTVRPRVAIFSNGPHKGANPAVLATLRALPEPPAIFQVHRNLDAPEVNPAVEFIANPTEMDEGRYIKISLAPDSLSYTVRVGNRGKLYRFATH